MGIQVLICVCASKKSQVHSDTKNWLLGSVLEQISAAGSELQLILHAVGTLRTAGVEGRVIQFSIATLNSRGILWVFASRGCQE